MPTQRDVEECPYRVELPGPGASARCGLVEQISGVRGSDVTRVNEQTCAACSRAPTPSRERLNPVVASLLFVLTDDVIRREGVPGCDALRAEALKGWALGGLTGADRLGLSAPRPRSEGRCFHLGAAVGTREYATPRGRVRVESLTCHHPLHERTTSRECQGCLDFDPDLGRSGVSAWAVGVVTAPRDRPTLARCLRSLADAGWDRPRLFVEPGADVPGEFSHLPATRRESTLGEWPNWLLGLAELYQRDPEADAYMMVQDDTVFTRGVRTYLETALWPAPRVGMVSVYCPEPYAREEPGWHPVSAAGGLIGALACVFPNAAARSLLAHPGVIEHRRRGARQGLIDTDGAIGRWARQEALPIFYHSPSLAQHVGDTSTVWPGAPNAGARRSNNFAGEGFDARQLPPRRDGVAGGGPARDLSPWGTRQESTAEILDFPLISCIMPTADRREFVRLSLGLFLAQDYPRKELIVVDDGEDPVGDLAEGVPGVWYIRLGARATIGEKRNLACREASGEIIAHWDDDDWYSPNRLRYQAGPIVADEADLTGLLGTHMLMLPDEFWTVGPGLHRRMFFGDVHGGTLVYHRSLWDEGSRYPDASLGEDVALLRQALGSGKRVARLGNPGVFLYVRHPGNSWVFDPGGLSEADGWAAGGPPAGFPATMLPALQRAASVRRAPAMTSSRPAPGAEATPGVAAVATRNGHAPARGSHAEGGGQLVDCLGRVSIHPPSVRPRFERCVATVVSPGFSRDLDDLLGSLRANGGCPDVTTVVFAVDPDGECRRVAAEYGAVLIPCASRAALNPSIKAVLYSAARVVDADRFVCLDADMLVLGDLRPVFAALDACPEGSILAAREGNRTGPTTLSEALLDVYHGRPEDLIRLGVSDGEGCYPLVVNDGLFAAGRAAMLALDGAIREWTPCAAWVDERHEIRWRNQFVFNLVLARLGCGVELDPTYNVQLLTQDVEWARERGRVTAHWRSKPVRVLHFNGGGRSKYPEWRALFRLGANSAGARHLDVGTPPETADRPVDLKKVLAAVVVYDRHSTVSTWLRCWDGSYRGKVPLAVCHTLPGDRLASAAIRLARPDIYLPLPESGGQDIAALRHVVRSESCDWEALFWCTDDVLPMRRDFLDRFVERMKPGVGLVGLHIVGPHPTGGPIGPVYEHVRTVAFLIRREAAVRLAFPDDSAGKRGCYGFEHADPVANMTAQVRAMGYHVTSVRGETRIDGNWKMANELMWDVGHCGIHFPAGVEGLWRRFSAEWGIPAPARLSPRVLVLAHVFYEDLWAEIAAHLRRLPIPFDLAINAVRGHVTPEWEASVREGFPGARVCWSENRGLDVGGTIVLLQNVDLARYDLVCKVHTKKCSSYDPGMGQIWRRELLRALFDDTAAVFDAFGDQGVSMVSSLAFLKDQMTVNRDDCVALCHRLGLDPGLLDGSFAAGTMFWCRPFVFQALKDAGIGQDEFPAGYARDGTLAHAVERIFGVLARSRGTIVGR